MIIETILGMLTKYIFKDPCITCLVKVTCKNAPFLSRPKCDVKTKWRAMESNIYSHMITIENIFFLSVFIVICIILLLTVGFGIWKWCELISDYLQ